jgi:hypothetical protein
MPTLQQALDASPIATAYYDASDQRVIVERKSVPPQIGDQRVPPQVAELTHYDIKLQRGPAPALSQASVTSLDQALAVLKTLDPSGFDAGGSRWQAATPQIGFEHTIWTDNSSERGIPPLNPLDEGAPKQRP